MQDLNHSLNTKIALTGLSHYLDSNINIQKALATTALAMYLENSVTSKTKIIAQIALAIHLQNNPNDTFSAPFTIVNHANYSAWSNKILMMRQLPNRR
ncbi:MAG: hypothetical protein WCP69_02905 [Bacteroidota bacterium]